MRAINSIADLRELARRRVPRAFFDYVDRGSYDELTLARNRADLDALCFRQRVLRDVAAPVMASSILGREVATLVDGLQAAGFKSVQWNAAKRKILFPVYSVNSVYLYF